MENEFYLAADSGGTKTDWVLLDSDGDKIQSLRTRGLAAVRDGILPVSGIVTEAAAKISHAPTVIYLSLGGANTAEVTSSLKKFLRGSSVTVEREANGNAVLFAASFLGCNSVVMCGTGSVAVGDGTNGRIYCGGWGPLYGDGGSGGGIGSAALKLFLKSLDNMADIGEVGKLFLPLTEGLDIKSFDGRMAAKARALSLSRRELAAFAADIYALAERGDQAALSLYLDAAREIAALADRVTESGCALLCGGFFKNKPILLDACRNFCHVKLKYVENFSPITAAQIAALRIGGKTITNELFKKILKESV